MHRLVTRLAVQNLFHPFQPFMMGQKYLAPKLAMRFDIPLVFYGENEAEYGNPIDDNTTPKRDTGYNACERSRVPFSMNAAAATVPGFVHRETRKCLDGKI